MVCAVQIDVLTFFSYLTTPYASEKNDESHEGLSSAVFELHGSQSMPGPLTYFHYPIGPTLLRKTWVQRTLHLFFCNSITGRVPTTNIHTDVQSLLYLGLAIKVTAVEV